MQSSRASIRAVILTHYFPPEVGAPQARLSALAAALARRGASVVVHSGPPNYPDGRVLPPYTNRPVFRERHPAGFCIVRSAVYASPNRGFGSRLLNHASFAASAVASAPFSGPADVVLVESPPLFLAGGAIAYARLKRAPLVINVSDLWPDSAVDLGALTDRRAIGAARGIERAAYRAAAAVVAPTEGICARLQRRPESAEKVVRIGPTVELDRFRATAPFAGDGGPLRVLYAGTVGLSQGLETLAQAAALAGPTAVEVTIAGGGAEASQVSELVTRQRIANVKLLGIVAHSEIPGLYAACHAAVVVLRDRPVFREALPTKMLEAMATGRPIVLSAAGEAARFVERCGCGIVARPEDPEALAEAFHLLTALPAEELRAMGERGRAAVGEFSTDRAADRWLALFERVIEEHSAGRPAKEERRDSFSARLELPTGPTARSSDELSAPDEAATTRLGEVYWAYRSSARRQRAWDATNRGNVAQRAELERAVVMSGALDPVESVRVLDLGCGPGYWLRRLAALGVSSDRMTGVEVLPERVAAASSAGAGATIVEADAVDLPLPSEGFDVVLLFTVLSSLVDKRRTKRILEEAYRVTAPAGTILIYEPRLSNVLNPATRRVTRREVTAILGQPTVRQTLTLLPPLARRLGPATTVLYPWLSRMPLLRTHQLLVHRKGR